MRKRADAGAYTLIPTHMPYCSSLQTRPIHTEPYVLSSFHLSSTHQPRLGLGDFLTLGEGAGLGDLPFLLGEGEGLGAGEGEGEGEGLGTGEGEGEGLGTGEGLGLPDMAGSICTLPLGPEVRVPLNGS